MNIRLKAFCNAYKKLEKACKGMNIRLKAFYIAYKKGLKSMYKHKWLLKGIL